MGLVFFLLTTAIILMMIWVVWRLDRLQRQLGAYNDYINDVQNKATEQVLTEEFIGQMRNRAQLELTNTVKAMSQQLQQSLGQSNQQLMNNIEQQATQIINGELEQYRKTIADASNSAAKISKETEEQLMKSKESIQKEARAAVQEEKQQLLQQLDGKLSDIVTHYLVEALGEHVDLGSQKEYIISQLESHKEEIKQDINDEF